jgi:demethylmenaquinone methyltransferase/2-methoxy-6-polyprenyl-1,4-benzoquinol methylase
MSSEATAQDVDAARHFYDRISGVYDALSDASEGACRDRLLERLAPAAGERALEVGFGTGHVLETLARAVGGEGRVVGLDVSEGMARQARERLAKQGLSEGVELRVGAAPPLPFPDASFDLAVLSFTLELFPEPAIPELLGELRRTLQPEGRLGVVSMAKPREGRHESALSHTYRWLHRHFPHIVDCQPIDAEAIVETAGFEIAEAERMEIWTLPVAVLVARPRD